MFIFISLLIAGLFAYQVQNLTKEIKKLRNEEKLKQISPSNIIEKFLDEEDVSTITAEDLNWGWYRGTFDQKKINTPSNWVFKEAGEKSCWHKPNTICN